MSKTTPKTQKRLGRGLSSLISPEIAQSLDPHVTDAPTPTPSFDPLRVGPPSHRLMTIPADQIRFNPMQPRRSFDEASLASLSESLKQKGPLQPIIVRPAEGGYELVAGERRLRAARLAGIPELPAIVRFAKDEELLELALIENVHRADLNPVERARAYRVLAESYGLSHEEIGRRMGDDRATVSNYIRLLSLPDEVLAVIATGKLSAGHGRALLGISGATSQIELADQVVRRGWSVRRLEQAMAKAKAVGQAERKPRSTRPIITDTESRISAMTGTRVRIEEGRRRHTGRIVIEYYGLDDFERITALLGVKAEA